MEEQLGKLCNSLPDEEGKMAVDTLYKIIKNAVDNPNVERYRQLRTTNPTFNQRVWRHAVAQQFLALVGWSEVGEKIVLPSDEFLQDALVLLTRAKESFEGPKIYTDDELFSIIKDLLQLPDDEVRAIVKGIRKHGSKLPRVLFVYFDRFIHLRDIQRDITASNPFHEIRSRFSSLRQEFVGQIRQLLQICEQRDCLLLRCQKETTVNESQGIETRLARLDHEEQEIKEKIEYRNIQFLESSIDRAHKPNVKMTPELQQLVQTYQDELQELLQKRDNRQSPAVHTPASTMPLDFSAYITCLPASAKNYLDKQLDWDHGEVDVHLDTIAHYMTDWEVKLTSLLGLTDIDVADLKLTHPNPILLRRAVLRKWKDKEGLHATYRNLLKLCCKGGDARTANTICKVLKEKAQELEGESEVPPSYSSPHPQNVASAISSLQVATNDSLLNRPHPLLSKQLEEVGSFLNLPKSTLEEIESKHGSTPSECLKVMLMTWLAREQPPPTWSRIIEVVQYLQCEDVALTLKQKDLEQ